MSSDLIVKISANALNIKKARELNVIKVSELTTLAEYFVIATATSSTHVRSLTDEVLEKLKQEGCEPHHIEGKATGWTVLDFESVIVHIFTPSSREFYGLDKMWGDGEKIELDGILTESQED